MDPALWRRARFLTSAYAPDQLLSPDQLEIAVAGRSNSGKSSLINKLTEQRGLARASRQPGRTQAINFFALGDELRLVDLPGYGYAKAPAEAKARWQETVAAYFGEPRLLLGLILTVDIRRLLGELDHQLLELAADTGAPVLVALTKADKLRHGARQKALAEARRGLEAWGGVQAELFSSQDGMGVDAVRACVADWHANAIVEYSGIDGVGDTDAEL